MDNNVYYMCISFGNSRSKYNEYLDNLSKKIYKKISDKNPEIVIEASRRLFKKKLKKFEYFLLLNENPDKKVNPIVESVNAFSIFENSPIFIKTLLYSVFRSRKSIIFKLPRDRSWFVSLCILLNRADFDYYFIEQKYLNNLFAYLKDGFIDKRFCGFEKDPSMSKEEYDANTTVYNSNFFVEKDYFDDKEEDTPSNILEPFSSDEENEYASFFL